jgi:hypothetical protein
MVQADGPLPLLAEKEFEPRAGPCGLYVVYSEMGHIYRGMIVFSPCQNDYTTAPYAAYSLYYFYLRNNRAKLCEPANKAT